MSLADELSPELRKELRDALIREYGGDPNALLNERVAQVLRDAKLDEKVYDWYARKDAKAKRSLWKKAGITAAGHMAAAGLAYLLTRPAREATVTKATFTMTYEGKDWVLPAAFEDKVLYFMQTADHASIDSKLIEADIADGKQDYIIKNVGVAKLR